VDIILRLKQNATMSLIEHNSSTGNIQEEDEKFIARTIWLDIHLYLTTVTM